jgi:serine protease AprX
VKRFIQISFLLGLGPLAFADQKGSNDLPMSTSGAWVDVIIQFNNNSAGSQLQGQLNGIENMLMQFGQGNQNVQQQGQHGDKILHSINALHLKIPSFLIPWLKANPAIKYISPDRPTTKFLDLTTAAVSANVAWQSGWDGTGVGVAVIDSGIALKHDLTAANGASRVVYSENFASGQTSATDAYGHGTHVAGIIGSAGRDSTGLLFKRTFKGVAPNVNLINLRVLDPNGAGMEADVISAIQRAIDLKNVYNIRVINLSLGRPVFESYTLDPLCQAVEAAWKAGIVVVTAAGNFGRDNSMGTKGYGTIASPGNDPYVITVGAMKTNGTPATYDDTIASYSSKGPTLGDHVVKPDLVAPGNQVISLQAPNNTLALNYPRTLIPNVLFELGNILGNSPDYFRLSGTSMATPVVSGAAALLIQQHPSLTPDQVKARLMKTALKPVTLYSTGTDAITFQTYNSQADIFTIGAGYLNIAAALANNDLATLPALSPVAVRNPVTHKTNILRGSGTWGDTILWGDGAVYGNIVFTHTALFSLDDTLDVSVLWGDTVIWGQDDSVLWGDTVSGSSNLSALSADDNDL